jgi:hypothetical protein
VFGDVLSIKAPTIAVEPSVEIETEYPKYTLDARSDAKSFCSSIASVGVVPEKLVIIIHTKL